MRIENEDFFGVSICRKSHTFEDISEASKCPHADILSFFPALLESYNLQPPKQSPNTFSYNTTKHLWHQLQSGGLDQKNLKETLLTRPASSVSFQCFFSSPSKIFHPHLFQQQNKSSPPFIVLMTFALILHYCLGF